MGSANHRFVALDGMRGICALLVVIFHANLYTRFNPAIYGYLSVDVFFVISGFVIAFAFGNRLAAGLGLPKFLLARACRLGPVHLFGTLLCFIIFVTLGSGYYQFTIIAKATLLNLFLVPSPVDGHDFAFPLNVPTWSLFVELWVNVCYALIAPRLTRRLLITVAVAGWAISGWIAYNLGTTNFGPTGGYVYAAVLRGGAAFACGALIFNLWQAGALARLPSVNPVFIFAAFAAIAMLPLPSWHGFHDLVAVTLVAPFAVALLVRTNFGVPAWALWLGRISYPLYATHFIIVAGAVRLLGLRPNASEAIVALAISLLLAEAVARWYEPAAKRALSLRKLTAPSGSGGGASVEVY